MPARTAAAAACSLLLAAGIVGARVPGPHAVVSSNAQLGTPLSPAPLVLRKHYRAADRTTGRYQYLPFDVTADVSGIRLSYSYDREGGNAIGLGLFEPGPLTFGTAAFLGRGRFHCHGISTGAPAPTFTVPVHLISAGPGR